MAGNDVGIKLKANANLAYFRDQFLVIPKGSFKFYPTYSNLIIPFVEGELTPYTATPKIGLSIATIVEFGFGYGFDIKTKQGLKSIESFTFSLGFKFR